MIRSIRIENFKGFINFELKDLARINVLGGKNNVGKTSLMEALSLIEDRTNPNLFMRQLSRRGIVSIQPEADKVWGNFFNNASFKKPICITSSSSGDKSSSAKSTEELKISYIEQYLRPIMPFMGQPNTAIQTNRENVTTQALNIIYKKNAKTIQNSHLMIDGMMMHQQHVPLPTAAVFLSPSQRASANEDAVNLGKLTIESGGKGKTDLLQFLRDTFKPSIDAIDSVPIGNTAMIYTVVENRSNSMPIAHLGDGMNRVISILMTIATNPRRLIFIDEIENGIHYSILPKIWLGIAEAAAKYECQLFITTHSLECIRAAYQGIPETQRNEFRYVRLDQGVNGLNAKSYDYEIMGYAIEQELEVR
uniref:ATPase AAA-type core domain-containing protein n=1 Tax=mine drainage metagenome TaxID=410659 RepID=E6QQR8_9ZZZZ